MISSKTESVNLNKVFGDNREVKTKVMRRAKKPKWTKLEGAVQMDTGLYLIFSEGVRYKERFNSKPPKAPTKRANSAAKAGRMHESNLHRIEVEKQNKREYKKRKYWVSKTRTYHTKNAAKFTKSALYNQK
jgi:hypothetical protein